MTGSSYFLLHLIALVLPGVLISRLIGFRGIHAIVIPACGYIFYTLLAILSKYFNWSLDTFLLNYIFAFSVLLLVSVKYGRHNSAPIEPYWALGFSVVIIGYSLYRYFVGPYIELPADLYRHLEFARSQLDAIHSGHLGDQRSLPALFTQKGGIWYSFFALISFLCNLEFSQSISWASYANGLIFLSVVYCTAWYLFTHTDLDHKTRCLASVLASFFLAAHMGINVFAYLRYYSMAPTMLNMTIYFAAVVAILELMKWRARQASLFLFIVLCLSASAAIHTQEALYILIASGMVLAWFALFSTPASRYPEPLFSASNRVYYRLGLTVFIIGFFALEIWTYTHVARPEEFANKIVQLSQQGPILNRILSLNPTFQGINVITIWGLFVYAIFIAYWRKFIAHPYLFAGMFIPFFTVFNPIFVDWFLRMDGVHTLWRMLYIVPLPFVAALSVIYLYKTAKTQALYKRFASVVCLIALFALLLPLSFNSNSRLTLGKNDQDETYTYWQDLIENLNQPKIKKSSILTDPVTGYMLSGLTKHRTYQYKFLNIGTRKINFKDYSDAPLKKYKGWLLIINDREGGFSESGAHARHWPADILQTSKFYTPDLRDHIKRNPENRFSLLWNKNDIWVYRIQ